MVEQRRTAQLLVELENEVKRLMLENDALKRRSSELTTTNKKLKQSLDQTTKVAHSSYLSYLSRSTNTIASSSYL